MINPLKQKEFKDNQGVYEEEEYKQMIG